MSMAILGGVAVVSAAVFAVLVRRSRKLRRRQRAVLSPPAAARRRSVRLPAGRVAGALLAGPRWRGLTIAFGLAALVGWSLGGVVAAVALGAYGAVAAAFVRGRQVEVARRAARSAQLDRLTGLAADLRAGLPVQAAAEAASPAAGASSPMALAQLAAAAVTLAERTGAPLADLIDRIEADARTGDRALTAALAQAAGTQATALLLAALPIGGLAMGYAIGTDPLEMLLHTPLGAVCAFGAVGLQILGLFWSQRLQPRSS